VSRRAVAPHQLLAEIEGGRAPLILDVRSAWEFRRGCVPGATHIPFWAVPSRASRLRAVPGARVVVYCGHGPRAWFARAALARRGFSDVSLLRGHMSAWRRAGLRVAKPDSYSSV
jgi:rhodanese-related sulfurtransferase